MKFSLKANVEVIAPLSSQDVLLVGLAAVYPAEIELKCFFVGQDQAHYFSDAFSIRRLFRIIFKLAKRDKSERIVLSKRVCIFEQIFFFKSMNLSRSLPLTLKIFLGSAWLLWLLDKRRLQLTKWRKTNQSALFSLVEQKLIVLRSHFLIFQLT